MFQKIGINGWKIYDFEVDRQGDKGRLSIMSGDGLDLSIIRPYNAGPNYFCNWR